MPDLLLVEGAAAVAGTFVFVGLAVLDKWRSRRAVRELFPGWQDPEDWRRPSCPRSGDGARGPGEEGTPGPLPAPARPGRLSPTGEHSGRAGLPRWPE